MCNHYGSDSLLLWNVKKICKLRQWHCFILGTNTYTEDHDQGTTFSHPCTSYSELSQVVMGMLGSKNPCMSHTTQLTFLKPYIHRKYHMLRSLSYIKCKTFITSGKIRVLLKKLNISKIAHYVANIISVHSFINIWLNKYSQYSNISM